MAYQVLARKWRPQVFEDVIGQNHIAQALQNAVKARKVAHAYLFSGPRGVGKTTMARILAKALNCADGPTPHPCNRCDPCREITAGTSVDVLEIDGASNTSVDHIRELREMVKYVPIQGKHKIYIIDEVHMLSNAAFNALLKTLEEPPPHIVFIFATTELHKIPATIRSRCQHYQFKRIALRELAARLGHIAKQESVEIGEQELFLLAKGAEGSVRDALSLLDQVLAYGGSKIRQEDLLTIMGVIPRRHLFAVIGAIQKKDASAALGQIRELVDQGHDLRHFCHELVEGVRDLLVLKISDRPGSAVECTAEELEELKAMALGFSPEELQWLFNIFTQTHEEMKNFFYPPFILEMAVVRAARIGPVESIEKVLEKVLALEDRLKDGGPGRAAQSTGEKKGDTPQNPVPLESTPLAVIEGMAAGAETTVLETGKSRAAMPAPGISEEWRQVVQRVKAQRPYLASYLDQGVLKSLTETEVIIGFPRTSSFLVDLVHKEENLILVNSLLKECFERPLRLRSILLEEAPGVERKSGDIHPVVKEALKILGGEVIDPKTPP